MMTRLYSAVYDEVVHLVDLMCTTSPRAQSWLYARYSTVMLCTVYSEASTRAS